MRISVFGLGYVGCVSAGCLAAHGHRIIGVDPNETKVQIVNEGRSPVIEQGLDDLIAKGVSKGNVRAVTDEKTAVTSSELSLVCVGTPSRANGSLDTQYLSRTSKQIGAVLKDKSDYHVIVIRSTILPGTTTDVVIPTLEAASGKRAGSGFGVCVNPQFLREGSAVYDFDHPPKTVIGTTDERSYDMVEELFHEIDAPLIRTSVEVAEMVKYVDNFWHALKVTFGNEVGNICKALDVDSHEVMNIFFQDTKLNLSSAYLRPGFAFGGSCLPKDLRALLYKARSLDVEVPVLDSVLPSNRLQVERGIGMIIDKGRRKIGVLGFSFKAGTDDLRESPVVEVIERLIGKGYDVRLYDGNVNLSRLMGANRHYIIEVIPHISKLMAESVEEVLEHAEVVVIGNADSEFRSVPKRLRADQVLVDFVRVRDGSGIEGRYDGICW